MSADEVLLAATGLASAVIGAASVLWAQRSQWKRDRFAAAEDGRSEAALELVVMAQALDIRAHELMVITKSVGSPSGVVVRLFRGLAPVDLVNVFEAMNRDVIALNRAAARLCMTADPHGVHVAEGVVDAAARMIQAHQLRTHPNRVIDWFLRAFIGPRLADGEVVAVARRDLARAREAMVEHLRISANLPALRDRANSDR